MGVSGVAYQGRRIPYNSPIFIPLGLALTIAMGVLWPLSLFRNFIIGIGLPILTFVNLTIFFIHWPLINIALVVQFLSHTVLRGYRHKEKIEDLYLPRLPEEVLAHICSYLSSRTDICYFAEASRSTYNAANPFLYRSITLDEHPSSHVPRFRRRLHRLDRCLTDKNASYVRLADFSFYTDLDETYLLSILKKCNHLKSLSLPAIQEPMSQTFGNKHTIIRQPVFLSTGLSKTIYTSIEKLTWTGPFIPFRDAGHFSGRESLKVYPNLKELKILYRCDEFTSDEMVKCPNAYASIPIGAADRLLKELASISVACPHLQHLTLPFWEPIYATSVNAYKTLTSLRKLHFLALDGPMKTPDYGKGMLKFILAMKRSGVDVTFDNPWKSHFDIAFLVDEIDLSHEAGILWQLPSSQNLTFGPTRNVWRGRERILLSWLNPGSATGRQVTLKWPINPNGMPEFTVPTLFNGVEFLFNIPCTRGDARQFVKWRGFMNEVVELAHVQWIHIEMEIVNAFYLAFPFFMQYSGGNRVLKLEVRRELVQRWNGESALWIRRQWKIKRKGEMEEDVLLEDLAKDGIHVHPARLFERNMVALMFNGERRIQEITCAFHDRYSRSYGGV